MNAVNKLSDKLQATESEVHLAQETNSMLFKSKKGLKVI